MTATYDVTSDSGKVRLLISDTNVSDAFFQDAEIEAFLSLESDNIKMASALALEVFAANEVLVNKKITMLNLTVEADAVSKELRLIADRFRESALADMGFEIAQTPVSGSGYDEKALDDILKESS